MKDLQRENLAYELSTISELNDLMQFDYADQKRMLPRLKRIAGIAFVVAVIYMFLPILPVSSQAYTANAAAPTATGKTIDAVNVRKGAGTSTKSLGVIKSGTKVTITNEVFTSKSSSSASTRWYAVKGGGKTGYIRADLIKISKYNSVKAVTIDDLNYRSGAGTSMSRKGTAPYGMNVTVLLPAKAAGSSTKWYRVKVDGAQGYMCGDYLDFSNKISAAAKGKKGLAATILARPTNGGRARIIGTLNSKNCKKRFNVTGRGTDRVPQAMAYTGNKYYFLFGMAGGQSIVTYSSGGKRLKATKYGYNLGKPNAMTWDPITGKCYILRGSQNKAHVWDPATNRFSSVRTPYSSSGIAYDSKTKKIYATSLTGVRVYSSDGKFKHEKRFSRCYHDGTTYVQDCGAYGGFIFHGISGSYKFGDNYLDIYRAKDGKYLGSFKVNLGEIESVVVNNKGYVELLFNNGGTWTETLWQTPINVKNLM